MQQILINPFLKWAGGKRWFFESCAHLLPESFNRYIEPFLGSGAVYFGIQPKKAILSDLNGELISTYSAIKSDWNKVKLTLNRHQNNHCKEYYYQVRSKKLRNIHYRAAQFIYLNRTCWNGLYRVNKNGWFNVPVGTKTNVVLPTDDFCQVSRLLKGAELVQSDFRNIIGMAKSGDLVFVDPPYTVKHNFNGFIKYNDLLFKWEDQIRLRDCLVEAKNRGVQVVITNADHPSIREIYRDDFSIKAVQRMSLIAANSQNRDLVTELVIRS